MPPELHWFCPLSSPTTPPDDEQPIKIEDPEDNIEHRRGIVINCLQLLGYDGEEALVHQEYLKQAVDRQLGRCDACIVQYYKSKRRKMDMLRQ